MKEADKSVSRIRAARLSPSTCLTLVGRALLPLSDFQHFRRKFSRKSLTSFPVYNTTPLDVPNLLSQSDYEDDHSLVLRCFFHPSFPFAVFALVRQPDRRGGSPRRRQH